MYLRREEREKFIRDLTSKQLKNIRESIITSQTLKTEDFFPKVIYQLTGKNNGKHWGCGEVECYANECKSRKNNKLSETLGSLDYFGFSKEATLNSNGR